MISGVSGEKNTAEESSFYRQLQQMLWFGNRETFRWVTRYRSVEVVLSFVITLGVDKEKSLRACMYGCPFQSTLVPSAEQVQWDL